MARDSEYTGADGMFGNVDAGAPLPGYLEAVAYRRSATAAAINPDGTTVPRTPSHGTGGVRVN